MTPPNNATIAGCADDADCPGSAFCAFAANLTYLDAAQRAALPASFCTCVQAQSLGGPLCDSPVASTPLAAFLLAASLAWLAVELWLSGVYLVRARANSAKRSPTAARRCSASLVSIGTLGVAAALLLVGRAMQVPQVVPGTVVFTYSQAQGQKVDEWGGTVSGAMWLMSLLFTTLGLMHFLLVWLDVLQKSRQMRPVANSSRVVNKATTKVIAAEIVFFVVMLSSFAAERDAPIAVAVAFLGLIECTYVFGLSRSKQFMHIFDSQLASSDESSTRASKSDAERRMVEDRYSVRDARVLNAPDAEKDAPNGRIPETVVRFTVVVWRECACIAAVCAALILELVWAPTVYEPQRDAGLWYRPYYWSHEAAVFALLATQTSFLAYFSPTHSPPRASVKLQLSSKKAKATDSKEATVPVPTSETGLGVVEGTLS